MLPSLPFLPLFNPHPPVWIHFSMACPMTTLPLYHLPMDPVRIEKFQAMKRYRKRREQQLLLLRISLIRCLTTALFLGLFLLCPLWLPHVSSCLKLFLFGSLPNVIQVISRPECLFVLGNIIVIYLVGESKFSKTSPAVDIEEEYQRRRSNNERQESKKEIVADEALVAEEEAGMEENQEEEKEPSDEIDKKAEDFIARINWQRRLEERRLLSYGKLIQIRNKNI